MTIKDIALALDISHTTVSRALRDHPRISKATCKKVKQKALELGYHTNVMANNFGKGSSKIIGLIVPDISVHFFTKVIEGVQEVLKEKGYLMILLNTGESMQSEKEAIDQCIKYRVDGILVAITMETTSFKHFEDLIKLDLPLVFYDRVANFIPVPKVITNDHDAAFNATQHLIQSGCQCIAHITASINLNNSNNRLYGYLNALKAANMEVDEFLIHYYNFEPSTIDQFLNQTLSRYPQLDGIFVFNDYAANYTINALTKLGKQVPNDISVIGFSDEPVAKHMTPQLSTVQQVGVKMGMLAAEKLMDIIVDGLPIQDEKIVINPDLVLRESTLPLA